MTYDLVIIGGGLAGSALAKRMADSGSKVLVLEKDSRFKDRVRGEILLPWGVAETRTLGIYDTLITHCAIIVDGWSKYTDAGQFTDRRDLASSNPHQCAALGFAHAEMQTTILQSARDAGADVIQGATVTDLTTGADPSVTYRHKGGETVVSAKLLVGADGRQSVTSKRARFNRKSDEDKIVFSGLLLQNIDVDETSAHLIINARAGQIVSIFPQGENRFRTYVAMNKHKINRPLSGSKAIPLFLDTCRKTGAPDQWFADARAIGPLASFDATPNWVETPYRDNVVLIGDAAGVSDPTWGCGMSLAFRDVRVLSDALSRNEDWTPAAQIYSEQRARYFESIHRLESWMTDMFLVLDAGTKDRRKKALPKIATDATRMPDITGLGPESPSDETARQRFYGDL